MAVVNLNEVDIPKVKVGDRATITMDAFPASTFTGKIVSIDTTGSISSGVTTYPAYIVYDSAIDGIYPNMAVDASIITAVKDNVVLVPNAAVQESTIRIMKNGKMSSVDVTVGSSNDTQTEITSGVNEGDTVVTGTTTTGKSTTATTSPFSAIGGRGGFGGR
jgi:multidrug efflux pump subunit AcrA (membrane-fusion protein)